jgi:hypothetical protein
MKTTILPYAYALLVFAIVAFLFILLGRIFLNVNIVYSYEQEILQKNHVDYSKTLDKLLNDRGAKGWKLERMEEFSSTTYDVRILLIFSKSKSKIKLF